MDSDDEEDVADFASDLDPEDIDGEDESELLVRLNRWQLKHGEDLPRRCILTMLRNYLTLYQTLNIPTTMVCTYILWQW
jgi:hypothetical protein